MTVEALEVSVVQLPYDRDEAYGVRIDRAIQRIAEAASADLVVLPELWAHGGFDYDAWPETAEPLDGSLVRAMSLAAHRYGVWIHCGSLIERAGAELYNTAVLLNPDGVVSATYRKIHRFGFSDGEPRLLTAGTEPVDVEVTVGGVATTMALTTCYDLRFPELYRVLGSRGVQIGLVPAAWPASRVEHWQILGRARAIENQIYIVACNLTGVDGQTVLGGHSQIVHPDGTILAAADAAETTISARLSLTELTELRSTFPVLQDRRIGVDFSCDVQS